MGATHSRFQNAHGLDKPGHFSTAYDLALISRIALLYPTFAEIVRKRKYQFERADMVQHQQAPVAFRGVEGIKTGTTSGAGYCLVAAASQDGDAADQRRPGQQQPVGRLDRLLSWGFEEFQQLVTLAQRGDVFARFPLAGGMAPIVAVASGPLAVVVRDGTPLRSRPGSRSTEGLKAPIRRGDASAPST